MPRIIEQILLAAVGVGYSYSFNAQAIIDYAVSKGSLVIAAAGNDNSKAKFYPASYDGVLSVAGTNFVDQKASWSNYGTKIDVASPGVNIWSTWKNNSYASKDGTSMAAPIVAGLAGLVANQFPNYTPLQIGEQIRVNSDNIYQLNPSYQNKLGYGRINAQNALSNTSAKSARINELTLLEVGNKNGIFESGENIKIGFKITNYLNPTSNLNISFSTNDDNIEFVKNGGNIGALNTLQEIQTSVDFLEVSIKSTAATDVDVDVLVTYSDNNYTDYEWITFSINPTYQIHTTENLEVTFNSKGSIGFDDYPTNLKGRGLIFKSGLNLMFEGALLYGTSASTVVNTARNAGADAKDNDFNNITPIIISSPGSFADKESYTKFNDAFATPQSLGIETEVYTYSFDGEENADFIFIRYLFKNTTGNTITNFYAGQYWDFDLDETSYDDDLVNYDFTNNFGYVYDDNGDPISTHIGLALLSSNQVGFFAMDVDGTNNNVISWDGFTDEEKWTTLSSGLDYASVDSSDISAVISGGPFEILPNEKLQVDFVVVAGDNLQNLTNNMAVAKNKYNDLVTSIENENILPTTFELYQNYPNPFNPTTTIKYSIASKVKSEKSNRFIPSGVEGFIVRLTVYDVLGREIATLVNQKQKSGIYEINFEASNYSSGVYYYKLTVGASQGSSNSFIQTKKMLLLK
ncbi:MAG: S8 family serine peptidase [Ignavibacteriales bacterium]|nr:S8 family serine peptidase [Ignavibacteriales bacterium]